MDADRPGALSRALRALCHMVDWTRRLVFGAIAIAVVVIAVLALLSLKGPKVPQSAILVVKLEANIVEQLSSNPLDRAVQQALGQKEKETLLWDVLDALHAAKDDARIKAVYLDLNSMSSMSSMGSLRVASLEELKKAIQDLRKNGKKVIAAADAYSAFPYYLAAQADEIYLHDLGFVLLEGVGRYRTYYKEGLDNLEIEMNVIRVGEYKSAVEPYLRNDMSPEDKLSSKEWMGDLWGNALKEMAAGRKLKPEDLEAYARESPSLLKKAEGDGAKLALEAHLVDHVGTREDVRARLVELAGAEEKTHSYKRVELGDYLRALGKDRTAAPGASPIVAVVVAKGEILDGEQPPGTIGGDSTAAILRRARLDEKVKAVVLRVDSRGGSATASEMIREECAKLREEGKPVVVSMGAFAASGGYWISTASDEIWASPTTVTGSIGIFGMLPTAEKPLAKYLGIHADGVGTAPLAGSYRPERALDPELHDALEQFVRRGYREFLARVAQARKKTPEEVDAVGRGRVWSGRRAREIGLVDQLGGLSEAVASAAARAGLGSHYAVQFVEKESKWQERLMAKMATTMVHWTGPLSSASAQAPQPLELLGRVVAPLTSKMTREMPVGGIYAYCDACE